MTDHDEHHGLTEDPTTPWWHPRSLLTPTAAAVAAFAIAFLTLDGQNLLMVGVQSLLGQGFGSSTTPAGYSLTWGLAALVPLLLVLALARVTLSALRTGWQAHLARAAVVVAAVAAVGAVLTALGGLLHDGMMG
jgi:hypothetical protein